MSKRSAVSVWILPVFILLLASWLAPPTSAQKSPSSVTGAPLKGVDVKLGKNPGGSPAARTITDGDGKFTFPVVPKGQYILTVELSKAAAESTRAAGAPIKVCYITINLPGGKKLEKGYDLARNKAFDPAADPAKLSTARVSPFDPLIFDSDGVTPLSGAINTSRSNLKSQ